MAQTDNKKSVPTLTNGKFIGRARTDIDTTAQQAAQNVQTQLTSILQRKVDITALENLTSTLTSNITDSDAKTALADAKASIAQETASRKDAVQVVTQRVADVEGKLSGYAKTADLQSTYATKSELAHLVFGVPIFQTLAEAREWEAGHEGQKALYIDGVTSGTATTVDTNQPSTSSIVLTDYTYQWTASGFSGTKWIDTKSGKELSSTSTSQALPIKNGSFIDFSTNNGMKASTALTLGTGAKTITLVAKSSVVDTTLRGVVGSPGMPALAVPGGGGARVGFYPGGSLAAKNIDQATVDTNPHVITLRADGASSTLTHDRKTVAAVAPDNLQFSAFMIGGQIYGSAFAGSVAEVRVYNRRLTDDELTALHTELGGKYGVTL